MRAMTLMQAATGGGVALVLVVAAGPAFRIGVPLLGAFGLLAVGAMLGAVAGAGGLILMAAAWRGGHSIPAAAIGGIACGLLACGLPAQRMWSARHAPQIHDISTDLADPPAFRAVLPLRASAANPVTVDPANAPLQRQAYPDLTPTNLSDPPAE